MVRAILPDDLVFRCLKARDVEMPSRDEQIHALPR
jgi:hypothetical protein